MKQLVVAIFTFVFEVLNIVYSIFVNDVIDLLS